MSNNDWKAQLGQYKRELEAAMPSEEKAKLKKESDDHMKRAVEFVKRRKELYKFLAGYKFNSGVFINNFLRNRNHQQYSEDIFHSFDYNVSGMMPNVFDDGVFSMMMVGYIGKLEDLEIAYFPIDINYIKWVINIAEVFDLLDPTENDMIVYRGCSTIERNGVNGLVSTTTDQRIAEQFSRGTVLKIHVPRGTKFIDVKAIRPKENRKHDTENEILLPPCDYEIISEQIVKKGQEPNNSKGTTIQMEIAVKPLDLLEEFLKIMENPPVEYNITIMGNENSYYEALEYLKKYIRERNNSGKNK